MKLEGSCHCRAVRFSVNSVHLYPYNLCYCSICRKTAGGGGYAINLGGEYSTLEIVGGQNISVYHARMVERESGQIMESPGQRHFCAVCGSALWVWDPRWPELVHPFASAIDSDLPVPPQRTHLMLSAKAPWVKVQTGVHDKVFDEYPDETIAEWHARLDLSDRL